MTWNMAYHNAAWRRVFAELRPDVLSCQEAVLDHLCADAPVAAHASGCLVHPVTEYSDHTPLVEDLQRTHAR